MFNSDVCLAILRYLPGQGLYSSISRMFWEACQYIDDEGSLLITSHPETIIKLIAHDLEHSGQLISGPLAKLGQWINGENTVIDIDIMRAAVRIECDIAMCSMLMTNPKCFVDIVAQSGKRHLLEFCFQNAGNRTVPYLMKTRDEDYILRVINGSRLDRSHIIYAFKEGLDRVVDHYLKECYVYSGNLSDYTTDSRIFTLTTPDEYSSLVKLGVPVESFFFGATLLYPNHYAAGIRACSRSPSFREMAGLRKGSVNLYHELIPYCSRKVNTMLTLNYGKPHDIRGVVPFVDVECLKTVNKEYLGLILDMMCHEGYQEVVADYMAEEKVQLESLPRKREGLEDIIARRIRECPLESARIYVGWLGAHSFEHFDPLAVGPMMSSLAMREDYPQCFVEIFRNNRTRKMHQIIGATEGLISACENFITDPEMVVVCALVSGNVEEIDNLGVVYTSDHMMTAIVYNSPVSIRFLKMKGVEITEEHKTAFSVIMSQEFRTTEDERSSGLEKFLIPEFPRPFSWFCPEEVVEFMTK